MFNIFHQHFAAVVGEVLKGIRVQIGRQFIFLLHRKGEGRTVRQEVRTYTSTMVGCPKALFFHKHVYFSAKCFLFLQQCSFIFCKCEFVFMQIFPFHIFRVKFGLLLFLGQPLFHTNLLLTLYLFILCFVQIFVHLFISVFCTCFVLLFLCLSCTQFFQYFI